MVTSNQEVNRRFYTEVLGLRRVKLTVNQDDIYHRHLFYADEKGTTGSAVTFFEWPHLPLGRVGLGSPHHLAYTVTRLEALPKWKAWLQSHKVSTTGPILRDDRVSLYLRDPDGLMLEITTPNSEAVSTEYLQEVGCVLPTVKEIGPDMKLTTFNHASPLTGDSHVTVRFFEKLLGLKSSFQRPNPDQKDAMIVAVGNEERPDFLRYLAGPNVRDGFVGTGSIHHIAMAVRDEEDQRRIMQRLDEAGIGHSGIIDRFWFKSLYFRDPEGNLLEIATRGPGYAADEPLEKLGSKLVLPAWLEPRRQDIEGKLQSLDRNNVSKWPPDYPLVPTLPESTLT